MERIVLDANFALSWLFHESADEVSDGVAGEIRRLRFVVPGIWKIEIANALLVAERRKRSTKTDTDAWQIYLARLPVTEDLKTSAFALVDTIDLAREYGLTVYDAAYLELALRESIPLATLDAELKKATKAAGVELFRPQGKSGSKSD